ncbi:hypothetical protein, partial [Legionella pneumophila]|uniref:hypothetical protein n=1 Tax=Legionella pneumophila TaxID=446 RepID=UPI001E306FDD
TTYALSVSAQGVDSGLDNNGNNIYLYNIAKKKRPRFAGSQFQLRGSGSDIEYGLGLCSGVVTLTQHQEVDHGLPGASSNYAAQEA